MVPPSIFTENSPARDRSGLVPKARDRQTKKFLPLFARLSQGVTADRDDDTPSEVFIEELGRGDAIGLCVSPSFSCATA